MLVLLDNRRDRLRLAIIVRSRKPARRSTAARSQQGMSAG
jgi:hypothetical protein